MAENVVEEISVLIEDLKNESSKKTEDLTKLVADIKSQIQEVREDKVTLDEIRNLLEKESGIDAKTLSEIKDDLENLQSLLADTSDIFTLSDEVKLLSHNLKVGLESIQETAGQDSETKSVLLSRLSAIEQAVSSTGDSDAIKEKILDLSTSYKQFTDSFTNKNNDLQSVVLDLKEAVNTSASNNFIASSSLEATISTTNNKIATISENVTSGLGEMNSKVALLAKDVRASVSDGMNYLKLFGNNLTSYFQGNTTEVKATLEHLKAGILEFYKRMNKGLSNTQETIVNKITEVHTLQTSELAKTTESIEVLSATIGVKSEEFKKVIIGRIDKMSELLESLKFVAGAGSADGAANFEALAEFNEKFKSISEGYDNLLKEALEEIKNSKDEVSALSEQLLKKSELSDGVDSEVVNKELSEILDASVERINSKIDKLVGDFENYNQKAVSVGTESVDIKEIADKISDAVALQIGQGELNDKISVLDDCVRKLNARNEENLEIVKSEIEKNGQIISDFVQKISNDGREEFGNNLQAILEKLEGLDNINKNSLTLKEITEKLEGVLSLIDKSDSGTMTVFKELRETLEEYRADFDAITSITKGVQSTYTEAIEELKASYCSGMEELIEKSEEGHAQILRQFESLKEIISNSAGSQDFSAQLKDVESMITSIDENSSEKFEELRSLVEECYKKIPAETVSSQNMDLSEITEDLTSLRNALGEFYETNHSQHEGVSLKLDELKSRLENLSLSQNDSLSLELKEGIEDLKELILANKTHIDFGGIYSKIEELFEGVSSGSVSEDLSGRFDKLASTILVNEQSIADRYSLLSNTLEACQNSINKNGEVSKENCETYLAQVEALRSALAEFYDNSQFNNAGIIDRLDKLRETVSSLNSGDGVDLLREDFRTALGELKETLTSQANNEEPRYLSEKLEKVLGYVENNENIEDIKFKIDDLSAAVMQSEQTATDKIQELLNAIARYIEVASEETGLNKEANETQLAEISSLRQALGEFYDNFQFNNESVLGRLDKLGEVVSAIDYSQSFTAINDILAELKSIINSKSEDENFENISDKLVSISEYLKNNPKAEEIKAKIDELAAGVVLSGEASAEKIQELLNAIGVYIKAVSEEAVLNREANETQLAEISSLRQALGEFYDNFQFNNESVMGRLDKLGEVVSAIDYSQNFAAVNEVLAELKLIINSKSEDENFANLSEKLGSISEYLKNNPKAEEIKAKIDELATNVVLSGEASAEKIQELLNAIGRYIEKASEDANLNKEANENIIADISSLRQTLGEFYDTEQFRNENVVSKLDAISDKISAVSTAQEEYQTAFNEFDTKYRQSLDNLAQDSSQKYIGISSELSKVSALIEEHDNSEEIISKLEAVDLILKSAEAKNRTDFEYLNNALSSYQELLQSYTAEEGEFNSSLLSELGTFKENFETSTGELTSALAAQGSNISGSFAELRELLLTCTNPQELINKLTALEILITNTEEVNKQAFQTVKDLLHERNETITKFMESSRQVDILHLSELDAIKKECLNAMEEVSEATRSNNTNILDTVSSIKSLITDTTNRDEIIEQIRQKISEEHSISRAEIDTLKQTVSEFKDNVSAISEEINEKLNSANSSLIEIQAYNREILPTKDSVDEIIEIVNAKSDEARSSFAQAVSDANSSLQNIISALSQTAKTEEVSEIISKFADMELKLADISENYEKCVGELSTKFNEYSSALNQASADTSKKIETSINAMTLIQSSIDELEDNLSHMVQNSGLIEILADVRSAVQRNTNLLSAQSEFWTEEFKISVSENFDKLFENMSLVGTNLEVSRQQQEMGTSKIIEKCEADVQNILHQLAISQNSIESIVTTSSERIAGELAPLKESLTAFVDTDFATEICEVKSQIQDSYSKIIEEVNSVINDNISIEKVSNLYSEVLNKINFLNTDFEKHFTVIAKPINVALSKINGYFEKDHITELKHSIDNLKDELFTKLDYETTLNNIIQNIDNIPDYSRNLDEIKNDLGKVVKNYDAVKETLPLLSELNSKIDVFAQDDSVLIELESVSDILDEVHATVSDMEEDKALLKIIESKLDIIADNNVVDEGINNLLNSIKELADTFITSLKEESSKLEGYIYNLRDKLDDISGAVTTLDKNLDENLSISSSIKDNLGEIGDIVKSEFAECQEQHNYIGTNVENIRNTVNSGVEDLKGQNAEISSKLSEIKTDTEIGYKLNDLMNALHNKVDVLAMADDSDVRDEIEEIHYLIEEHIGNFNTYASDKNVDNTLKDLLGKINKVDMTIGEIDLSKEASEIKTSVINALVALTNEISFTEETEEIKDFVEERTGELHRTLKAVQHQLSSITTNSDDINFYSYTLQDVEKDLAKIRFGINELVSKSPAEDLSLISTNFGKVSKAMENLRNAVVEAEFRRSQNSIEEDVVSISSRVNQLLLAQKDLNESLLNSFDEHSEVAGRLLLSNQDIEDMLRKIDENISQTSTTANVLKNVMTYLGEWMDDTTETLSGIYSKTSRWSTVEEAVSELRKSLPNNNELLNFIEKKFELQESRLDRLEKKLDSINNMVMANNINAMTEKMNQLDIRLSKLGENIEKLVSYVE